MALETGTFISSLVQSNPTSTDSGGQGDDHLRLIKATLRNTFPNASRAFRFPYTTGLQSGNISPSTSSSDNALLPISARTAARTVTLPTANLFDGFTLTLVKADYSVNTITILGNTNTINGQTSIQLTQAWQSAKVTWFATYGVWIAQVDPVDPTGSWLDHSGLTAPTGYIFASGKTIGSELSGATERANQDCLALFQHLWNTYPNTVCPVSGGRGVSALADFDNNKTLTILDQRGRVRIGRDNMGNVTAGRVTTAGASLDGTSLGAAGGTQNVTLPRSALPNTALTATGTAASGGAHTHFIANSDEISSPGSVTLSASNRLAAGTFGGAVITYSLAGTATAATVGLTSSNGAHTHVVTATTDSMNGGVTQTAVIKIPPALIQNACLKL